MNVNSLTVELETDAATELPQAGDRVEWMFFGEEFGFVVAKVRSERRWVTAVEEGGPGRYVYAATVEYEWEPDEDEGEESDE